MDALKVSQSVRRVTVRRQVVQVSWLMAVLAVGYQQNAVAYVETLEHDQMVVSYVVLDSGLVPRVFSALRQGTG